MGQGAAWDEVTERYRDQVGLLLRWLLRLLRRLWLWLLWLWLWLWRLWLLRLLGLLGLLPGGDVA
jgi:signal transduction histidine kinase